MDSNELLRGSALQIVQMAHERGAEARMLGSIAILIKCGEYRELLESVRPPAGDVDLVALSCDVPAVCKVLEEQGYAEDQSWRMLFGYHRRLFHAPSKFALELYIDKLRFCQDLDLRTRLCLDFPTLCLTDLFLSRIQKVHLEEKDLVDICVLLASQDPARGTAAALDMDYISRLASRSWRWWRTLTDNLLDIETRRPAVFRSERGLEAALTNLRTMIAAGPRSVSWRFRSLVGKKVRWYAEVESS